MEKLDKKTIVGLIIAAIIVVVGIICLALFNSKGKPASEEELTAANNAYKEYVFSMTYGYGTKYDGIDKLYEKDETTYDTLHRNVILNAATRYATDHLEIAITKEKENALKTQYGYTNNYVAYNGNAIKEAVKILYGKEWEHGSGLNDNLFGYDFNYIATLDVYVRTKSTSYYNSDGSYSLDYKTIKAVRKKDKVILTVAIAYAYKYEDKFVYTSDSTSTNTIYEVSKDELGIKEDSIDKFPKYEITFAVDSENNYIFESIKKA